MKKASAVLAIMLLSGLFVGCTKKEAKRAAEGVVNYAKDSDLQGTFRGPCVGSNLPGIHSQSTLKFDGAKFQVKKALYAEGDCSKDELGQAVYSGGFTIDDKKVDGQKVKTIDISLEKAQIAVSSNVLASAASAVNYCGVSSYELNKTYNITPNTKMETCFVAEVPAKLYGSYRIAKDGSDMALSLSESEVSDLAASKEKRKLELQSASGTSYVKSKK